MNPNLHLVGTQQKEIIIQKDGEDYATIFEIDLPLFLEAERLTREEIEIVYDEDYEEYFDTF
jgi:hypothetical protein